MYKYIKTEIHKFVFILFYIGYLNLYIITLHYMHVVIPAICTCLYKVKKNILLGICVFAFFGRLNEKNNNKKQT